MPRLMFTLIVAMVLVGCGSGPRTAPPVFAAVVPAATLVKTVAPSALIQTVVHQETAMDSPASFGQLIAARDDEVTMVEAPLFGSQGLEAGRDAAVASPSDRDVGVLPLNLPSTLAMIGGDHPVVGQAQWRVREAYAQLAQAEALWLPSIQAGMSFHRHDGNYQASDGRIVDVNRSSLQYGLGTGATGAGTTNTRPGLVAQFHLADAIFAPQVAGHIAAARDQAATATLNEQLLQAATAYVELVRAHQDIEILELSRTRTAELAKITTDFAEAGQGLQADADRVQTERMLLDNRLLESRERASVASARLVQAASLPGGTEIVPADVAAVPLRWQTAGVDKATLIATGLATRPELRQSQALVAAACDNYRREKYAPFVPSVLLGFSTGGFGGGLGPNIDNTDSRYDLDALVSWEVRNLGLGERAARRRTSAQVQQAKYEVLQVMDQIALDIAESHARVTFRSRQIDITQQAIGLAADSHRRNLERIRDGQGLPLEVLQSVQALETAQRAYLEAVVSHNQAQLRLQWAMGWPVG